MSVSVVSVPNILNWVVIVLLACFGYVLIRPVPPQTSMRPVKKRPQTSMRPVKKQPQTSMRPVKKQPQTSMGYESGDGMQTSPRTSMRPVKKRPQTSMRPVKKQPQTSMGHESGDGMQVNHYCINFIDLPSTTTPTKLEDMVTGPGFLGVEVVGDIFSGTCDGMAMAYFEDKETAEAATKKCIKLGLWGAISKLDKPWSGFRRLSEMRPTGFCKVRCYGVGATDFGSCFRCGLPSHYASECQFNP